ncbi:MAG TPA: chorismate mutase [Gaiellaceae bacterium]|nr:chorismate mutase [Gaiellaceae bacterium]
MTAPARIEEADGDLAALREQVAACDRAILEAVNRRVEVVRRVRRHKAERGVPFIDPAQEQRLLAALAAANGGPISEAGLRELFSVVLALSKREAARAELAWRPAPKRGTL